MHKLIIVLAVFPLFIQGCKTKNANPPFNDNYNIVWDSKSKNSSESMPVVGGDMACNVWVENGELLFYLSRSGSFDEHGTYLKLGRVRVKLSPDPFEETGSFRQELKLHDGFVEIKGQAEDHSLKVKIKVWVEVHKPVVHVDVDANQPIELEAAYESWRTQAKEVAPGRMGERFAFFNLMHYPGKIIRAKDEISFQNERVLFYHRNPREKLTPEVLIKQQGLEAEAANITDDLKNRTFGGVLFGNGFISSGEDSGTYMHTPFQSWIIKSSKARKKHQLFVATHIAQAEFLDSWKKELMKLAEETPVNHVKAFRETTGWWNRFWNRSWIVIFPDSSRASGPAWQMARNYQLFRYQLGGNVFGEYPTKFNGGSLTFDPVLVGQEYDYGPDWRKWGGNVFTAQNQRLLYWPMLKSGDFNAILAQFEMYRKGLPGATARVRTHFGHEGAVYCEYTSVPGIPFGDGWGWEAGSLRERGEEIPFGDPRARSDAFYGYGEPVEKGVMANRAVCYHWESQVEHAYMILEYHRFTGADISKYMPFIEQSLIFFDQHYRIRQKMRNGKELDKYGKLVIYPSTSCESYRGAKNPSDLISGLRACMEALLQLDGKYLSDEKKEYYRDFLSHIPDFSYGEVDGDTILKPAESWSRYQNAECPQFYPLFPFNRFSLVSDDMTVFKNTWKHGTFRKGVVKSWHQDGIFFARMGMTDEAADFNTRKLQDSPRRFPTFWGPGHDWVPDHNWGGSGMIGLQEMLMQTVGDKIVLFPAWPKDWDCSFKLHAPGKTIVQGELKNGKVIGLKVTPENRGKDIVNYLNKSL